MGTTARIENRWDFNGLALLVQDLDATGELTIGGLRVKVNTVAATGSTVADAAQLSEVFNVVTGADGTKGVKLPAAPTVGMVVIVKGTTSATLKVWPDAAATINVIGSNANIALTTVVPAIFVATSATQWYTIPLLPS